MSSGTTKNLITNILAMCVTMLANFIVTPIVTEKLGLVAYSYVGIINNLISFFTVLSYTLNSMVGRFYTINFQQGKNNEANIYISSALFSCIALGLILLPILLGVTVFLDRIIIIEPEYVVDVKLAFLCSCISFLLSTINSVFATGAYATNKLYITNAYTILSGAAKAAITYALFKLIAPHIWFISITALAQSVIVVILAYISFKKLVPSVKFSGKLFSIQKSVELLKAGSFNAVIMMGNTLMTQIDLLVGNRLIEAATVGAYSVVLTFSTMMRSLGSAISNSFSPTTLKVYADKGVEGVRNYSNRIVTLIGILLGWPSTIIACFGCAFTGIWLHRNLEDLYYIFVILMLPMGANLACTQLYVVQQAVNRLKVPAIASILAGILNIILAFFLAKNCNMGIYGIAVASTISYSVRNLLFQPLYTSYITNQPPWAYFIGLIKPIIITIILYSAWSILRPLIEIKSFVEFVIVAGIFSVAYFIVAYFILDKSERNIITKNMKVFLRRKNEKSKSSN